MDSRATYTRYGYDGSQLSPGGYKSMITRSLSLCGGHFRSSCNSQRRRKLDHVYVAHYDWLRGGGKRYHVRHAFALFNEICIAMIRKYHIQKLMKFRRQWRNHLIHPVQFVSNRSLNRLESRE